MNYSGLLAALVVGGVAVFFPYSTLAVLGVGAGVVWWHHPSLIRVGFKLFVGSQPTPGVEVTTTKELFHLSYRRDGETFHIYLPYNEFLATSRGGSRTYAGGLDVTPPPGTEIGVFPSSFGVKEFSSEGEVYE